jgi:hypothetical protein
MMGLPDGWLDCLDTVSHPLTERTLCDWAWLEDGTKVRVYKKPGEPWRIARRWMPAGRAIP